MIVDKLKANNTEISEEDLNYALASIGGRVMDIDLFCRKIKVQLQSMKRFC